MAAVTINRIFFLKISHQIFLLWTAESIIAKLLKWWSIFGLPLELYMACPLTNQDGYHLKFNVGPNGKNHLKYFFWICQLKPNLGEMSLRWSTIIWFCISTNQSKWPPQPNNPIEKSLKIFLFKLQSQLKPNFEWNGFWMVT